MNEILQKRIEEAAREVSDVCEPCDYGDPFCASCHRPYMYDAAKKMGEVILNNQWISVDEALPEEVQEGCCDDKFVLYCSEYPATASYDHKRKKWYYGDYEILGVTHWMPIPLLEGGEE